MTITRGGEGGLAGHRWLAGSLVWTIQRARGQTGDGGRQQQQQQTAID